MAFVEFPGADQVTESRRHNTLRSYRSPGHPPVLVVHTVEGRMARRSIAGHASPPHLWMDPLPAYRDIYQTMSLGGPALALVNEPGGAEETNHRGICMQVELQLFSDPKRRGTVRHVGSLTDVDLEWIGEQFAALDEIVRELDPHGRGILGPGCDPVPATGPADTGYGQNSQWRFTTQQWYAFQGVCSHAHVPDNKHYDTGELDLARIVEHANRHASSTGPVAFRELRVGSFGAKVKEWQARLNDVSNARLAEDRKFGGLTADATREYQQKVGLPATGIVDKATWDRAHQAPTVEPTVGPGVEPPSEEAPYVLSAGKVAALKTVAKHLDAAAANLDTIVQ